MTTDKHWVENGLVRPRSSKRGMDEGLGSFSPALFLERGGELEATVGQFNFGLRRGTRPWR